MLIQASCWSRAMEIPTTDRSAVGTPEPLGYDFVIFNSDGDGVKDDVAKLTCLEMSGGYGAFRLAVFVSGEIGYREVFDSEQYAMDELTYQRLCEGIGRELLIDTIYSVESSDVDGDGCDELVCRQYAWREGHSNHIGDVVSVLKVNEDGVKTVSVYFEAQ